MANKFTDNVCLISANPRLGQGATAGSGAAVEPAAGGLVFGYANFAAVNGTITAPVGTVAILNDGATAINQDGATAWVAQGIFVSTEQTGDGGAQSVAHGLGHVPNAVFATLTEFGAALACDIAYGAHTATNVVLTVTNTAKYQVIAF